MVSKDVLQIQQKCKIIGRGAELQDALYAIEAKKHMLIEGAVGVGKTIIAMALADYFKRSIYRIDGDERYTEQKMVGWFDPSIVMAKGYIKEAFIEGPLYKAMTEGAFLFINELNRMPEGTQNVLLPAMDERMIVVPRIGTVTAKDGFTIIATQNPEEYIGTSRLGEALKDRFVMIWLDYQTEGEEESIVRKETGSKDDLLVKAAVKIVRLSRASPDIRRGASIRGAIDLVLIVQRMTSMHISELDLATRRAMLQKATIMSLSSKIEQREGSHEKQVEILRKIADEVISEMRTSGDVQEEPLKQEHTANF
jgi:MoxR-like ATPase